MRIKIILIESNISSTCRIIGKCLGFQINANRLNGEIKRISFTFTIVEIWKTLSEERVEGDSFSLFQRFSLIIYVIWGRSRKWEHLTSIPVEAEWLSAMLSGFMIPKRLLINPQYC